MNGFNLRRAAAIARKEVRHIWRDPFTLAMALGLPLVLVTIFGIAIDLDVHHARFGVDDRDHTTDSRTLADVFANSGAFNLFPVAPRANPEVLLKREEARGVLIIEPKFERNLLKEHAARAQVLIDGADNTTAGTLLGYLGGIQAAANAKLGLAAPPAVTLATRFLYNPELKTPWFIVPGLITVVISIVSILLTALTVAREWENGSMELLLSMPVRPAEFMVGKLAPYTLLGLIAIAFIYVAARLGFGLPFRGNHLVFLVSCLLFLSAYLAQGLLVSVVTRAQQIAMQFAIVSGLLPSILLSGFIFPIESMPTFFHYFTAIFPARWFMIASRDLFLKGTDFAALWPPLLALLGLNVLLFTLAVARFKTDLEP